MDRRGFLRLGGAAALVAAGGPSLVACADKAGEEGTASTVRSTDVSWLWAPYLYAVEKGFFTDEGLDEKGTASGEGENAGIVVAGQSDFLIGAPASPMKSTLAGKPMTMFAGIVSTYASNIVITEEAAQAAGLTETSSNEEKAAALRGLRIATTGPGAGPDLLARYVATELGGLNPDRDMSLVPIQDGESAILAAVENDAVDGFCLSSPTSDIGIMDFDMQYLFDMSQNPIDELVGYLYIIFAAQPKTLEDRPDDVAAYCRALQRGLVGIAQEPEDFKEVMRGLFEGIEPEIFERGFEANKNIYSSSIEISQKQYEQAVQFLRLAMEATGENASEADGLEFGEAVDTSFAKDAIAEVGSA